MDKTEKMRGCVALCGVALANMRELRDTLLKELYVLFMALDIKDNDSEKIEDPELYKIALDLEYNAESLRGSADDLQAVLQGLEKVKIMITNSRKEVILRQLNSPKR